MRIAVVGGTGQLGSDIVQVFKAAGADVRSLTHAEMGVSDLDSVAKCLRSLAPTLVVNTAAMHNVELCEQQPERAFAVNAIGTRHLATITRDLGAVLVHISTDYVFDGMKGQPYVTKPSPAIFFQPSSTPQ